MGVIRLGGRYRLATWTFAIGSSVSTKLEILGDGATAAGAPTYPTGKTNVSVFSGGTTFGTALSYTFNVAKDSAYERNWKFGP
jgi:hypothetical protein